MLDSLQFIFSNFWVFLGVLILISAVFGNLSNWCLIKHYNIYINEDKIDVTDEKLRIDLKDFIKKLKLDKN